VLDAIESARLGDVPPAEIFNGIETYLRSSFARTIEHAPTLAIEHQPAEHLVIEAEPALIPAPPY
jgi:hypothetical protein